MSERVCIVGAGSTGLAAAKILREEGIDYRCFEMGSDVGGNWRYDNDNGRSAAYASLHIDTSKDRMAFSDFPMPDDYPNYPHHSQVRRYFDAYADHFGLRPTIEFRTRVTSVEPRDGGWEVEVEDLETGARRREAFPAVLVCNGHHWDPNLPAFPGRFAGTAFHSRRYRDPEVFEGKRVLVVGIGNSGCDIACDAAGVVERVYLSTRRGAHVVPRWVLGRPADHWVTPLGSYLPVSVQRPFYRLLVRLERGDQRRHGVPVPSHRLLEEHPTLSQHLLPLAARGEVVVKPDVAELRGDRVAFRDGSEEAVDVIVYATGYRISFPFLSEQTMEVAGNRVPLYRRVVHPDRPGLYFLGLIQPLGAIMPLAELQARWVALLLRGAPLPPSAAMRAAIRREERARERRYVRSPRHTIQVDFYPYRRLMKREIRRARRALRRRTRGTAGARPASRPAVGSGDPLSSPPSRSSPPSEPPGTRRR